MKTYMTSVVAALQNVLPSSVFYELWTDGEISLPAITYMEYGNHTTDQGDAAAYSEVAYMVKLWTDSVADIDTYCPQIDTQMRALGFKRTSAQELSLDDQICKLMVYTATSYETFE